jgi:hypothetical protein
VARRNIVLRCGRIGDENDGAAFGAEAVQCIASGGEGAAAVVQDAPHVAEKNIVAAEKIAGVL